MLVGAALSYLSSVEMHHPVAMEMWDLGHELGQREDGYSQARLAG